MRFTQVVVNNIGPFAGERKFDFNHGTVGIFGANGSGKSTLIDIAYACVTNNFNRFYDRASLVNNQCGEKEPANVTVRFEHEGVALRMFQDLRKSKFEFQKDKDKVITSRNQAMDILAELGVDCKVLDFCVFKRQPGSEKNAIDDFLRSTPTARAEAYMILNQTQHCGLIYDTVGDILNHDKEFTEEIVDNSDELLAQKGELQAQVHDLTLQKEQAAANLMKTEHLTKARDMLSRAGRLERLQARQTTLNDALLQATTDLQTARERQAKRQKLLESAEHDVKEYEPRADAARETLAKLAEFEKKRDKVNKLQAQVTALSVEAKGRKKPAPPESSPEQVADAKQEAVKLRTKLEAAKKTLAVFGKKGMMSCPTCGQDVAPIKDHLEEMQNDVDNLPGVIQSIDDAVLAYDAAVKATNVFDAWQEGWQKRYDQAEAARVEAAEDFMTFLFTPIDKKELDAIVDAYNLSVEAVGNQNKLVQQSAVEIGRLTEILKAADKNVTDNRDEVKHCTFPAEVLARANQRMKEHNAAEIAIANIDGRLEGITAKIGEFDTEIAQLKAKLARGQKVQRVVKILRRVHEAFHAKALPQRVAEANLALMEGDINKNLELLGEPFWVETAKGLSFMVHKPGEPAHLAEQLSGGQKAVLAMAFWPALNSLYKTGGGMLVLDEPTANMDSTNQMCLRNALEALSKSVRGRRQVVIVTHAELLKPAFDQVIQL